MRRVLQRLGAVQIDAVNVLVRSHYLPLFSRLGPYRMGLLDELTYERGEAFEYDGHAAAIVSADMHRLFRWRMQDPRNKKYWDAMHARFERERPGYVEKIIDQIERRGPLGFTDLEDPGRRAIDRSRYAESTMLWGVWPDGKWALESMLRDGRLAVAGRRNFERLYDLAERVIAAELLAAPTPSENEAKRALVLHSTKALGVATMKAVADYFRLPAADTRRALRDLVEAGALAEVKVEGWQEAAYMPAGARPEPIDARALLSPFDSLLWWRPRNKALFGFEHSFEIYVPAAKRRYGYYVLPFLLGERFVGRVDLKADRKNSRLLVQSVHLEPGVARDEVAQPLEAELDALARWLGLRQPAALWA